MTSMVQVLMVQEEEGRLALACIPHASPLYLAHYLPLHQQASHLPQSSFTRSAPY